MDIRKQLRRRHSLPSALVALVLSFASFNCFAVGSAVVKNGVTERITVCINGSLQGTIEGGRVARIDQSGYSGSPHQGGWNSMSSGTIFAYYSENNQGKAFHYVFGKLPDGQGPVLVTVFGDVLPTDDEAQYTSEFGPGGTNWAHCDPSRLTGKSPAVNSGLFVASGGEQQGVLTIAGLQWTQSDNGRDIDWNDARAYCGSLNLAGGGWRLPTMSELSQIYDDNGRNGTTPCGDFTCKVSPKFHLTGTAPWSGEQGDRSSEARHMLLDDGSRLSYAVSSTADFRALCVRRRS